MCARVCYLCAQSCLTLATPMDCSPPGSSLHWISHANNTGVGCHSLLQGIFPTQGLNLHLLCLLPVSKLQEVSSCFQALVSQIFTVGEWTNPAKCQSECFQVVCSLVCPTNVRFYLEKQLSNVMMYTVNQSKHNPTLWSYIRGEKSLIWNLKKSHQWKVEIQTSLPRFSKFMCKKE